MENTTNEAKSPKQRAEAKFKMVGTKLKEQDYRQFEELFKDRGFENGSQYIKHLIDFDTLGSIEEERKHNELLTKGNELLRVRLEEMEKSHAELEAKFEKLYSGMDNIFKFMNLLGNKIEKLNEMGDKLFKAGKTTTKEKKGFIERFKSFFGGK